MGHFWKVMGQVWLSKMITTAARVTVVIAIGQLCLHCNVKLHFSQSNHKIIMIMIIKVIMMIMITVMIILMLMI